MRKMIEIAVERYRQEVHISPIDRIRLYQRLSLYLRSGIPIREALSLIRNSANKRGAIQILNEIEDAVLHGTSLEHSLGAFPKVFSPFERHLVGVGERSGSLPQNLAYLASLLSRRRSLIRKLRSALIYPCLVVLGTLGVTSFLFLYTFPKLIPIFKGLNTPLPLTTKALIFVSDIATRHEWKLLLGVCVLTVAALWLLKQPTTRKSLNQLVLATPILRELVQTYYLSLISRTLSTLLASGISLVAALEYTGNGTKNERFRSAMEDVTSRVTQGHRFSTSLGMHTSLFPHSFVELIAAGESTGTLSSSLVTAAEAYEEELDENARTLSSLLEPALMIAMGLLVGFVAMAIITPIYSVTQDMTLR